MADISNSGRKQCPCEKVDCSTLFPNRDGSVSCDILAVREREYMHIEPLLIDRMNDKSTGNMVNERKEMNETVNERRQTMNVNSTLRSSSVKSFENTHAHYSIITHTFQEPVGPSSVSGAFPLLI